jgi:cell wall-associated NlpC family hydrolase
MSVSLSTIRTCFDHCAGRVTYLWGSKPALGSDSASFGTSDCSGFSRWCLNRAGLTLPEGSATQHEWCAAHLREVDYQDAATLADASRLFIAFIVPVGSSPGHVVLLNSGKTLECCGSGGCCSRAWNTPHLANISACYEVPAVP